MEYIRPTYILFAGVNGSGKSTLYKLYHKYENLPRINSDEIARQIGDWTDNITQMKAGRTAIKLLKEYFRDKITFNQETTLCGKSILKNVESAKKLGYKVEIHYIGIDDVEICKQRIRSRVLAGGHGIPDADVERRYKESFTNMRKLLPFCDKAYFYDNTDYFTLIAAYENNIFDVRVGNREIPRWFNRIMNPIEN